MRPGPTAGIWEWWRLKETPEAEDILSCSTITTVANSLIEPIHDRMPVMLGLEKMKSWLQAEEKPAGITYGQNLSLKIALANI